MAVCDDATPVSGQGPAFSILTIESLKAGDIVSYLDNRHPQTSVLQIRNNRLLSKFSAFSGNIFGCWFS